MSTLREGSVGCRWVDILPPAPLAFSHTEIPTGDDLLPDVSVLERRLAVREPVNPAPINSTSLWLMMSQLHSPGPLVPRVRVSSTALVEVLLVTCTERLPLDLLNIQLLVGVVLVCTHIHRRA